MVKKNGYTYWYFDGRFISLLIICWLCVILESTTTKFAIQNGINQPCRINTCWFLDHYVTKFANRHFMILISEDFSSKGT